MTPQQICDYKMKWLPGHIVLTHSDDDCRARIWCKEHTSIEQWKFTPWSAPYEHTFHFESEDLANKFSNHFGLEARRERRSNGA